VVKPIAWFRITTWRNAMKRTATILMCLAVPILTLLRANVTVAGGDAQDSPPIDLSGPWMSSVGPVILKQDGSSITGSFTEGSQRVRDAYIQGKTIPADQWNAAPGTITDGVIDSTRKTFVFKIHMAQSQLEGNVTLTLSNDGGIWEGPYTTSGMGGNYNGTWTMWRNKCGSAKYLVAC
jgi:hypothetical protein